MRGWRQTIILGTVGNEPTLRYTQSGVAVCSFSVVVNEEWERDGEKHKRAYWHKISAWRQLGEVCNQHVHKGMQVHVVGNVEARGYTNNNGEPAASLELTARDVQFLGGRGDSNQGDNDNYPPAPDNQSTIPF